ncbi:MAG: HNH endonuclease, partial [Pseudomonadota bacterium]|nr:HNH endonuclease [Pseudomonadota bacterium]
LNTRNEFYIESNLPLAEAIINQTGNTSSERKNFLNMHYQIAKDYNHTETWSPKNQYPCTF